MNINIGVFDTLLGEGEHLEWVGKSEPFKLMDGVQKKRLTMRFLICGVIAVVLTAAYVIAVSASGGSIQALIPILTIGVPLFVMVRPVMDCNTISKKLIYAVTNKRIIAYQNETTVADMDLDKIGEVKVLDRGNGIGNVAFGVDAVSAPEHKHRFIAIQPKYKYENSDKLYTGIVFYNVAEHKKIISILNKDVKVKQAAAS